MSYTFITQAKWNPVHTLALSGLVTFMDKLLDDGVDINVVDKVSFIYNGVPISISNLIVPCSTWISKPQIHLVKQYGLTALHTAIIAKKEAVISHLLRKGASPHIRDGVRKRF